MNITGRIINAERHQTSGGYVVVGEVYEDIHSRFHDGSMIRTSLVVHEDGPIISTKHSIYEVESWRAAR